jgi:hypothetical protein
MLTSVVDEDASHYLCGDAVEVRSILPLHLLIDEFQVGFIHQSRRLQRVIVAFTAHVSMCQFMQFVFNHRYQFFESRMIPLLHAASSWVTSLLGRGDILEFVYANGKSWERGIESGWIVTGCASRQSTRSWVAANEAANCSHELNWLDWLPNVNIEAGSQGSRFILLVSVGGQGYCDQLGQLSVEWLGFVRLSCSHLREAFQYQILRLPENWSLLLQMLRQLSAQ